MKDETVIEGYWGLKKSGLSNIVGRRFLLIEDGSSSVLMFRRDEEGESVKKEITLGDQTMSANVGVRNLHQIASFLSNPGDYQRT